MKILYYDCFSGISGDMNLGALLDLGVDKEYFLSQLGQLPLDQGYEIRIKTVQKKGINGTRVEIKLSEENHINHVNHVNHANHINTNETIPESMAENKQGYSHWHGNEYKRTLSDIERIVMGSSLPPGVKSRSMKIFDVLAQAEATVHGIAKEQVHFHEVGAVDAILDIVGAAICLEYLQVDKIMASKVELGGGFVKCEHGLLPVPAPAVVELLQGVPVKTGKVEFETTTPTGAAILAANVEEYTEQIDFRIEKVGYGIGMRDLEIPNVLRVYLGEIPGAQPLTLGKNAQGLLVSSGGEASGGEASGWENQVQWMLETNLDDMNPEIFDYVEEKLFANGALDVYKTPIIMKKGRPAVKLSVLAPGEKLDVLKKVIFLETSVIGLRSYTVQKTMLKRKLEKVETRYGFVQVKFSFLDGELLKYKAEYEDCRKLAIEKGISLREIYREVDLAFMTLFV